VATGEILPHPPAQSRRWGGGSPGVGNRPSHKQPARHVEKRQPASCGLGPHDGNDLFNPLRLAALVAAPLIHLLCLGAALAGWRWLDPKPFQELGEFCAGAVIGRLLFLRNALARASKTRSATH